jgi:type VI secretion system secreted protein VgrG
MDPKPQQQGSAQSGGAKIKTPAEAVVRIAGAEIKYQIAGIVLEQLIDGHHQLSVRVKQEATASGDTQFSNINQYTGFLGESISFAVKPTGQVVDASRELAFTGLVTEVRLENAIDGLNSIVIIGTSPTIALDGARMNAFYFDQKASDIISATLQKYPITAGTVEASAKAMSFCVQYRETDYDLVKRLAAGCGLFALYDGTEFQLVKASSKAQETLAWRETLGAFSLGLGTAQKEYQSAVFHYEQSATFDRDSKSVPLQSALSNLSKKSPDASDKIYKKSGFSVTVSAAADMQALDDAVSRDRGSALGRMIRAVGESNVPSVRVGRCVKITGMAELDGSYWVQQVTHTLDDSGYSNRFVCSPLDMASPQPWAGDAPRVGLQTAIVVDNNDPEKLGRIKVKFPWSGADQTVWIRLATPYAGAERGWYSLPEVADEVLVGFEHGSPSLPVAFGALYNKNSKTAPDMYNKDNNNKVFVSRGGSQIFFSDEAGKETIRICTAKSKNSLVMEMAGPSITIESAGDITIKGANITIDASKELLLKSGADLKAKAGANMANEASANCDIKASGQVNVKGAMINLN